MTQQDTQPPAETLADRALAADILDEVSNLLDHNGIGEVADLIRDGMYDEHEVMGVISRHRVAALTRRAGDEAVPCKVLETIATTLPIGATDVGKNRRAGDWTPADWTQIISDGLGVDRAGCWRCGALSEVLARILSLNGHDATIVSGTANDEPHVWVEIAGEIFDPTAAQFIAPIFYRRAGGDAGAVAALIQWARDQMALPDGSGWLGGHIDENHRYKLRDLVGAIDAALALPAPVVEGKPGE